MTRILILYASLGAGHYNAAKALSQAFSHFPGVTVWNEDALAYASPIYRSAVTQAYKESSEKMPQLYKAFYEGSDVADLERSLDNNKVWATLERPFFRKLGQLLKDTDPDAVVCVQQIPSRLLQLLAPEDQLTKAQYVVVTDLIAHSTWINYGVDRYFVPNDLSVNFLVQRGVNPSLLQVTGIPVKLEIMKQKSKQEVRSRYGLPTEAPVITLFGGGLNAKRVHSMVAELLDNPSLGMLIISAGRNDQLLETIADLEGNSQVGLWKLGTIDYVDDLIVASDLIITKAGGLITSEILARGTPMIIVDPIPGQEEQNADVIAAAGAGVQLRLLEMVAPAVHYLLEHPDRLEEMRRAALEIGHPCAALDIAKRILNDLTTRSDLPSISQTLKDCAEAHAD